MGPEATFWAWLRRGLSAFPADRRDVHRIETSTETGYPDVEGCLDGACFLAELKVVHYVRKRCGTFSLPHYTPKQAFALHRRWKAGGRAWLVVRVPGSEDTGRHYLVPGREALIVHDERMRLTHEFMAAVSWPGFEDGKARTEALWRAISGPIV